MDDGRKWPSGQAEFTMANATWDSSWHQITRDAMDQWNNAGASFAFRESAAALNGFCGHDRGHNGGAIAETWVYPQQPNTSLQEIQIEVNLHFSFDPPHPSHSGEVSHGTWDLHSVLLHELGHALHLRHSADPNAIMYQDLAAGPSKGLSPDDINEIRALYP